MIDQHHCFGPGVGQHVRTGVHGPAKPRPLQASKQTKRKGQGSYNSVREHLQCPGPPSRSHLLKVPPPPDSATLGTRPLPYGLWGILTIPTMAYTDSCDGQNPRNPPAPNPSQVHRDAGQKLSCNHPLKVSDSYPFDSDQHGISVTAKIE